jgi:Prealbumin-like fold domain
MKSISRRPLHCIVALVIAVLAMIPVVAFARVFTDQPSYSPGDAVTISGDNSDNAGYVAGEAIHVVAGIPNSYTAACDATADASGAWSCGVRLPLDASPIGQSSYTATGQSSGVSQTGSFTDGGCKNSNALGTIKQASNVGASFTTSGNVATYSFESFTNESPSAGVPGLIEYCVYTSPIPDRDSVAAQAIGANGDAFLASTDASKGEFAFERKGGDPSNVPLDGTTRTMGTATFNAGVPTTQTITLHINDPAECSRIYGAGSTEVLVGTCHVLPGTRSATLTLKKVVDHSGTSDTTPATAWTLSAKGPSPQTTAAVTGTDSGTGVTGTVSPGTYDLSESGPGAPGWTSSGFICTGSTTAVTSVTLASGDNKTCTITNTAVPPKLTVNKTVVPSSDAGTFNLQIDGATAGTGANVGDGGTTGAVTVLTLGSHTVGETAGTNTTLSNYDTVIGGDCSAAGAVSLALGDVKTCTITNTGKGNLTIIKKTIGGDATFPVSVTGPTPYSGNISTSSGTGSLGPKRVTTGSYFASETLPANWVQTSSDCTNVTVPTGGDVTCTITNTGNGKITIVKKATGHAGGGDTFTFPVSGSVLYNGTYSSTKSITTSTAIAGTTFRGDTTVTVPGGSYSVTENPNSTWVLTGAVCYSGAEQTPVPASAVANFPPTPATFTITPGSQETCVFEDTLPVTRTQGFWATHFNFTNAMWASKVPTADQQIVCGTTVVKNITNVQGTGTSNLYGGFWAGVSKTTTGGARSALDQARMKLVQQLEAAILNHDVFGAPDNGLIAQAKAAYCGSNATAVSSAASSLGQFNQSGEGVPLDPSQFAISPAEPQKARSSANNAYWNVLP